MEDTKRIYVEVEERVNHTSQEVSELLDIILSYSFHETDFNTANKMCRLYFETGVENFRYMAILCSEHIARVYNKLVDEDLIKRIVNIALRNSDHKDTALMALGMMQSLVDFDIYSLYENKPQSSRDLRADKNNIFGYRKGTTIDPQSLFDKSVQVLSNRPRRYAGDMANNRYIVFDEYLPGKFTYHIRQGGNLGERKEFETSFIWDKWPDEDE
ncbi:MAG: hypothetical protein Q8R43_02485 [Alphaproteobacteria bacterium]|nr:hypothetical protein [Alphaproteobacteria bacterium]